MLLKMVKEKPIWGISKLSIEPLNESYTIYNYKRHNILLICRFEMKSGITYEWYRFSNFGIVQQKDVPLQQIKNNLGDLSPS